MFELNVQNIESIKTAEEFILFLKSLENDYKSNKETWSNTSLDAYFEAIAAWISAKNHQNTDWATFAKIMYIGKIYE